MSSIQDRTGTTAVIAEIAELASIEFRVIHSGSPARRMRLNTTRCTLGSGEGCTVRLNDSTLRSMHAVILRDANRVLLRAYTVPIEVNGHLTGETFLHLGDTFILGSYHFELVCSPELSKSSPAENHAAYQASHSPQVDSAPAVTADPVSPIRTQDSPPIPEPVRGRLSFVGGDSYVSEAFQAFPVRPLRVRPIAEVSTRAAELDSADQMRREVESWRSREQHWNEQQSQTRAELADAIARFQESQSRANEASDAVAQMRQRMSQLGQELESLSRDSIEFRHQATQHQERLRQEADAARQASESALRQSEQAVRERDQLADLRDQESRQRDEAARERENLAQQLNELITAQQELARRHEEAISERDQALQQRGELSAAKEEIASERDAARRELERSQQATDFVNDQIAKTAAELSQTQSQIELLRNELTVAGEQLRLAREEVAAAYARIEGLAAEAGQYREQLANRDHSSDQQSVHYESLLEELSLEVKRLEADCTAARAQATAAANDRELADSLQARLATTESHRNSDRLSWEQEAQVLQETIQQLSIELATATGRLTQTRSEHETTQAELNEATERLNLTRHELSTRPTSAQWDELQAQLAETEHQLDETERQLGILRRDYDELLGRQVASSAPDNVPPVTPVTPVTPVQELISEPAVCVVIDSIDSLETSEAGVVITAEQTDEVDLSADDQVWPTYQSPLIQIDHPADTSEPMAESVSEVSHGEPDNEPSIGSLAQDLIAQLEASKSAASQGENSTSVSQSVGGWVGTSSVWERVAEHTGNHDSAPPQLDDAYDPQSFADNDESNAPWEPVKTPSVWNLPSSYESSDSADDIAGGFDDGEANPYIDGDASEQTQMLGHAETDWQQSPGSDDDLQPVAEVPMHSPWAIATAHEDNEDDGGTRAFDFQDQFQDLPDEIEPAVEEPEEVPLPVAVRQPITPAPLNPDDDSIEAYMNRLLQRVQGQSVAPAEPTAAKSSAKPTSKSSPAEAASEGAAGQIEVSRVTDTVTMSKTVEVIDANTPLVPRSQAPEDAGNMAAMRELANATANSAISTSVRGQAEQLKSKAIMDLMQAAVVLVCAFAFFTCGQKISGLRYVWYTAAGLAAALAVFFVLDMLKKLSAAKTTYDRADAQSSGD